MNYYYLVASLPTFSLDTPPPLTLEAFRRLCATHLTQRDARVLEACLEGQPSRHPFVTAWRETETQLRNALARHRAARWKTDAAAHLRPQARWDAAPERAVAEAYARPTPLEREKALDRFRWQTAETLAAGSSFGLERLLAYGIQLTLCTRWNAMSLSAGRAAADAFLDRTVGAAMRAARFPA